VNDNNNIHPKRFICSFLHSTEAPQL